MYECVFVCTNNNLKKRPLIREKLGVEEAWEGIEDKREREKPYNYILIKNIKNYLTRCGE